MILRLKVNSLRLAAYVAPFDGKETNSAAVPYIRNCYEPTS